MEHSALNSWLRYLVWWLAQRIPMPGSFGTSIAISVSAFAAWGLFPLVALPLLQHSEFLDMLEMFALTPRHWTIFCWVSTGIFSCITLCLFCRLLTMHYGSYYDRYNIPGIKW